MRDILGPELDNQINQLGEDQLHLILSEHPPLPQHIPQRPATPLHNQINTGTILIDLPQLHDAFSAREHLLIFDLVDDFVLVQVLGL